MTQKHHLREYQKDSLNELRQGIRRSMLAQMLMLCTGAGKTTIASEMMQGCAAKGKRAFFIVDTIELIEQAVNRFVADGLEVGVIQGQHEMTDYSKPIQVASIQTLRNRWDMIAHHLKPDLVVIDEAHVLHQSHIDIITECKTKKVPVIGLSATPFRPGLGNVFDSIVVGATVAQLTAQGYLVPVKAYAPFVPDLKGVETKGDGDWKEDALAELMGDAKLVGDVVGTWCKLAEGRQTLVFAANVAHSKALLQEFQRAHVPAAHIDGYMDPVQRAHYIDLYHKGVIKVLCNVAVLTKGFDAPETSCIVLARPTKSLMLHCQILGRGLRIANGKSDCLILDHAGNCIRNGLPTDELPTELNTDNSRNSDRKQRNKEKGEKDPAPCTKCGYVKQTHTCPACGFKPERIEMMDSADGELVEINTGKKRKFTTEQKQDVYAQFLGYARKHSYQDGWAYHKCREYCGSAPRETRGVTPKNPSVEVSGWIKNANIKRAKRRDAA
jgi:superfamily II DNA or RNA helicase